MKEDREPCAELRTQRQLWLHAFAACDKVTAQWVLDAAPGDPDAVNVHAVALFLFAQVYVRRHHLSSQQPAMDVWPGGHGVPEAAAMDPSSPGRQRTNHTGAVSSCLLPPTLDCM